MKVLKSDLINKVETLEEKLEALKGKESTMRKEFAKAFGWTKGNNYSYSEVEYRTPTWQEIFTEIGKLLADKTGLDAIRGVSELHNEVRLINEELNKLKKQGE